ncbi:methylenetetrahydrofolate reductase [NAD(P)H] [Desulfoplanes sp.]
MKIGELLEHDRPFVSLEFFPPKERGAWPGFFDVVRELKATHPLFASVTYGAGGTSQTNTLEIATRLKQEYGLEPLAHFTCVGASESRLRSFLDGLTHGGIENVLALRGDPPRGEKKFRASDSRFTYAVDLVRFIRKEYPHLCIGVAGYPETHPETPDPDKDIHFLKDKIDAGADFVVTQLFFDNTIYFDFVDKARSIGITQPIIPGVLPVASLTGLKRMVGFCGASVPRDYLQDLEMVQKRYGDPAVRGLGLGYASAQVRDLLDRGAPGVHLYTLNKAETCLEIVHRNVGLHGA